MRARGYTGSYWTLRNGIVRIQAAERDAADGTAVRTMSCPSPRRVFAWLAGWRKLNADEPKREEHEMFIRKLCQVNPAMATVRSLVREFLGMMHRRRPAEFDRWLHRLEACEILELQRFASSLRADLPAVRGAFSSPWSNGQTEGHVNHLKLLKRQMYGRAGLDLLRLGALHLD